MELDLKQLEMDMKLLELDMKLLNLDSKQLELNLKESTSTQYGKGSGIGDEFSSGQIWVLSYL